MNETCEICGTSLTIQNSEAIGERQQVRMRHVPGNCAQVLYAKLTKLEAKVRALCEAQGSCGEAGCTAVSTCDLLRVLDEKQGA